jgi:hypothetical protein
MFQQQHLSSMSLASNKIQNNHLNCVNPQRILPLANMTNIGLSAIMNHNHANFLTNESSYKIIETNNQYDLIDDDETQDNLSRLIFPYSDIYVIFLYFYVVILR